MSYLSFKVIAETRYLQTIRICGNHPVLGQWDPHQSYPLTTTVSSYPEWTHESRIQIDPSKNASPNRSSSGVQVPHTGWAGIHLGECGE